MKKLLSLSVLLLGGVAIADSPFQASLTPGIAIHPSTTYISGLSLSIWGENPQSSLALGFVNGTTGNSSGFSWGLVNYDDSYNGVQWGIVNYSREHFVGWQKGVVNWSEGTFDGFQSGIVNYAQECHGFQLGVVNYSENMRTGVQVGLVNVIQSNGCFDQFPDKLCTVFPIVNWSF